MISLWSRNTNNLARRLAGLALVTALLVVGIGNAANARSSRDSARDEFVQSRPAGTPLLAIVSLGDQRVTIYDANGRILRAPVSTGQTGYETPAGIYSVIQKEAEHYSNLYDDASMPFMQRITWSGIALHAGALPGYAASHGCIRMPLRFAEHLFDLTKVGLRVVIVPSDVAPSDIAHPSLFQPKPIEIAVATQPASSDAQPMRLGAGPANANVPPPTIPPKRLETLRSIAAAKATEADAAAKKAEEARQAAVRKGSEAARFVKALRAAEGAKIRAETQLKDAERALETSTAPAATERAEEAKAKALAKITEATAQLDAVKTEGQPKLDAAAAAREDAKAAEAAKMAAVSAAKEAAAKMSPVSVFISRQTQRLYVRQAFQPVFEAPITISDADKPIGTHIYTALDYTNEGADVRWSAVSMTTSQGARVPASNGRRQRGGDRNAEAVATDAGLAKAALDRITIPKEAIDRISEVMSPGSSLIVSDEPIHKETGKGTDFVVLMSGEPQGGIKIRRRNPDRYDRYNGYDRPYGRSPYRGGPFWW